MCCTGTVTRRPGPFTIRLLDQQRHAQRRIVERRAGVHVATVRGEHDGGLVVEAEFLELGDQLGHGRFGAAFVDLHEEEEPPPAPRAHPSRRRVGGVRAVALDGRDDGIGPIGQVGVEERESLRDSGFGPQKERGDGGPGLEPAVLQQLRHRPRIVFERKARFVAHAMFERQLSRQKRRMGRQRQR